MLSSVQFFLILMEKIYCISNYYFTKFFPVLHLLDFFLFFLFFLISKIVNLYVFRLVFAEECIRSCYTNLYFIYYEFSLKKLLPHVINLIYILSLLSLVVPISYFEFREFRQVDYYYANETCYVPI